MQALGPISRQRFGPHLYDAASIATFYQDPFSVWGYLAKVVQEPAILAYSIVKRGFLEHDRSRLETYGLSLDPRRDCTFAPSVADAWQGQGIGVDLFKHIQADLAQLGIQRMVLWGGVQEGNEPALRYYSKLGFRMLGTFEHAGKNWDMVLEW